MRVGLLSAGLTLCSLGCASDTTGPAPLNPVHGYWQLTLNHHAITLALTPPYNMLQLVATPSTAAGTPLADSGVTTWTTSDTSVQVSPTGLLTAIAPATGVTLTVSRTIGTVTNTDMAVVNVNDTTSVPHFATLTLQQSLSTRLDTLYLDIYGIRGFVPAALDPNGDTIPNVVFSIISATPSVLSSGGQLTFSQGAEQQFGGNAYGHALMIAEATVYGIRRVDSLPVTVGWLHNALVGVHAQTPAGSRTPIGVFVPSEDTVAVGGTVLWKNELPGHALVDVVFDAPTAVQPADSATFLDGFASTFGLVFPTQGGGNIPAFAPLDTGSLQGQDTLGVRARRFPTAGTYHYHSGLYGTSGVVHVLPELQVP